ncbi:Flagellar hook-associated protein 1 [Candidatus Brocadiaceae bacterium B188]|nr:flagellar hook-associated protein FlgK [Candidatus Brocadia sapporoensis]QQR67364.1 MAG: flagellar hook-associated protein FlgK [Candidatus Brocadia sp.]RZV57153.1 MAG: flagellar hook-associated protein FlgK [Candidatus Brocadia sp. BROELEC01]TWU52164.1 Flagellar hook-associated protein 1 [Candidatus Brocadiaceae bacterium B188]
MSSDLQIGLSGLLAAQRAMLVTAHNISNANTKGYTRQSTIMAARPPFVTNAGTIGQGVDIVRIIRHKDDYINSRLRDISSSLGSASVKSQYLRELETVFNETSEASLNNALASFFKGINDLTQNPEDMSSRATLLEKTNTMTDTFHRIDDELNQMGIFVKQSIESKISDVNKIAENIAGLNNEISAIHVRGIESNDLLDAREALLQDLSKLVNITVTSENNGMVNVSTPSGTLVSGTSSISFTLEQDPSGEIEIVNSGNKNSKYVFYTGEIKGLQDFYNVTVTRYKEKLDTFASNLIAEVNKIHSEGVGLSGGFTSLMSTNAVSSVTAKLNDAGLKIAPSDGDIFLTVINKSTGEVTKNVISVDISTDSLADLRTAIDGIANISASIVDNRLRILADTGYQFNFSYALDPNPGNMGTSTASVSGIYSGQANDVYTFTALGTGMIGSTAGLQIEVKNNIGAVVATLDVGDNYTPGNIISVGNGVSLALSSGTVTAGDTFSLDVVSDSDKTDLLAALGINTFFNGTGASDILVNSDIAGDVSRIAASTGEVGNITNALRLVALQYKTTAVDNTTFTDYLHRIASSLGEEASNAFKAEDSFTDLETNLKNRRDEISGVSTDEELVNLVRFQQAYQASAKYISIVDGLIDKLLISIG